MFLTIRERTYAKGKLGSKALFFEANHFPYGKKVVIWIELDKPVFPVYMVTCMQVDKPDSFHLQIIKSLVCKPS